MLYNVKCYHLFLRRSTMPLRILSSRELNDLLDFTSLFPIQGFASSR